MIFVTVGTYKFDDLIQEVDRLAGTGRMPEPVLAQIAHGSYEPAHCEWFRLKPSIEPDIRAASLVISHGGTTMHQVLELGGRLIAVPNPALAHDHQTRHVSQLASQGYLLWCRRLDELDALVHSTQPLRSYVSDAESLVTAIRDFVDGAARADPRGRARHRGL